MNPTEVVAVVLGNLKTAAEIVKLLRSDSPIQKAEAKLKLAEVLESLADARVQLVDVQEAVREKDARIADLEEAFEVRDTVQRQNDGIYRIKAGKAEGYPHCLRCWEEDHRLRQLVHSAGDHRARVCPTCKTGYEGRSVPFITPDAVQ